MYSSVQLYQLPITTNNPSQNSLAPNDHHMVFHTVLWAGYLAPPGLPLGWFVQPQSATVGAQRDWGPRRPCPMPAPRDGGGHDALVLLHSHTPRPEVGLASCCGTPAAAPQKVKAGAAGSPEAHPGSPRTPHLPQYPG